MDGKSPEVLGNVGAEAAQPETPIATPTPDTNTSTPNVSRFNKLLARFGIKRGPKPLIEVKPPVASDSEGRARIDRNQLKQKLEEPSQI